MDLARRDHLVVHCHKHRFVEISTLMQRMAAQRFGHITPASNLLQHGACQLFFILCEEMGGAPKRLSFRLHYGFTSVESILRLFVDSGRSLCWNISVCKPHSVFPRPDQRPARSSSLLPMAIVQGEQPMLR